MSLKSAVGFALIMSLFLAGTILIFGMIKENSFFLIYFLFALFILGMILFLTREVFNNKKETITLLIVGLLFVCALTYSVSAAKSAYEIANTFELNKVNLANEINFTEQKVKYYSDYVNYFKSQIAQYQAKSQQLEAEIASHKTQTIQIIQPAPIIQQVTPEPIVNQTIQPVQQAPQQQPVVIPDERRREEDDD